MIIINNKIFETKEDLDELVFALKKNAYKKELKDVINIFEEFIEECHEADVKLQQMVNDKISENYISLVFIPTYFTEVLNEFRFDLGLEEGAVLKKREELLYQNLCDLCFGNIEPYYSRLLRYYQ